MTAISYLASGQRPRVIEKNRPLQAFRIGLSICQNECRAQNVTWLIRQFSAYVLSVNAGQREPDMVDTAIVGLALKDSQNLEAALRIGDSAAAIRRPVWIAFLKRVQAGLEEWVRQQGGDWEVRVTWAGGDWTVAPDKKWLPILLRRRTWPATWAGRSSPSRMGLYVFIGVFGPTQDTWDKVIVVVPGSWASV